MSRPLRSVPAADDFPTDRIPLAGALLPPVPHIPRPQPTRRRGLAGSTFAADVRRYGWLIGILLAGVLCAVLTRGQFLTWDGWQDIPARGAR